MVASFLGSQHTFCFLQVFTILIFIQDGEDGASNEKEDERDVDDNNCLSPQLRAEEDSARKIGGSDADDGGRGDKEGLNLKVLMMMQIHIKRSL